VVLVVAVVIVVGLLEHLVRAMLEVQETQVIHRVLVEAVVVQQPQVGIQIPLGDRVVLVSLVG
jgi:hypothetical protein